ncbi:unnamed protein product [Spirodela intermedia]|uniref:Kinesin-like protein n=1 Tax=Spirodela intermedia TaxID=51605 RepID=A0A7I8IF68_SPIIN|nr:unnamed protein product [Spirodela intermedia]CAA6656437.1 unnamed protein product [Spirodela intermedia]
MSSVVDCLLSLRAYVESAEDVISASSSPSKSGYLSRKRWKFIEVDKIDSTDVSRGDSSQSGQNSPAIGEGKRRNVSDLKFQGVLRNSVTSESASALLHHVGYKFHEVFQLKQGRYSELSASKISEMMKSNGLDNAPTQSLLSVVNGILDESIERKNDEIPHRVACLLRKVVQEIERRISTQAEHIRNQNNLIKAREEKYQSRIRALETLATGTSEESQMVTNQLQTIKTEKIKLEERKKHEEQDRFRLSKEKENSDLMVTELKQEMERKSKSYEQHSMLLEMKARETQAELEERIKEIEVLLQQSRQRLKKSRQLLNQKFRAGIRKSRYTRIFLVLNYKHFRSGFFGHVYGLRVSSNSVRNEVMIVQRTCEDEFKSLGNIRVYCRIRPFLPGQNKKLSTVDYISENGELLVVNPSKQGKDGHRMFKFNKVFGPAASQGSILDTRPLIRSVLDGYDVCIFAYGQTGSGKTYTMSGPDALSKEEWGVNYRALDDLFHISRNRRNTISYDIAVQMVEIYNEQVRDLLLSNGMQKKYPLYHSQPNGLAVPDASIHSVKSTADVLGLMQLGLANRAVGATALNERSSRSHSVLSVHVRGLDMETGASLRGTLHLVDLAGSERVDRSEATGDRLREAQHINKSLSALGDVIFALAQKSSHVPYRNSKLTQVLQTSLGGQAKTLMFVQINPEAESFSETVSTLKFAERVSGVELGAARSSKEGKDVRELMEQVASLKDMIARKDEEIGQLQLLKDLKTQPLRFEKQAMNSLRHSSSSPGQLSLGGSRKLVGRNHGGLSDKGASDCDNTSGDSDKLSETGSLQSMSDFGRQKEAFCPPKQAGESDHLGSGSADSEERVSDMSDGALSMGAETDGSVSESSKPMEFTEKM